MVSYFIYFFFKKGLGDELCPLHGKLTPKIQVIFFLSYRKTPATHSDKYWKWRWWWWSWTLEIKELPYLFAWGLYKYTLFNNIGFVNTSRFYSIKNLYFKNEKEMHEFLPQHFEIKFSWKKKPMQDLSNWTAIFKGENIFFVFISWYSDQHAVNNSVVVKMLKYISLNT